MSRANAAFTIKEAFQPAVARGYSTSLITQEQWENIRENVNVARVDIDTSESQPVTHAVMPAWFYGVDDSLAQITGWYCDELPDEEDAVVGASSALAAERDTLLAKDPPLSEADALRLWELDRDLADLQTRRFWVQAENAFGGGRISLYRACNAPNVPFRIRSAWRLQQDRPFTIFLHRAKPDPAQKSSELTFRFGHWALTFKQDKEITLVRYRDGQYFEKGDNEQSFDAGWYVMDGSSFDSTNELERQMADLRDTVEMDVGDREVVEGYKQQIRDLQADRKKNSKAWTQFQKDACAAQIAALRDLIAAVKAAKPGLGKGQQQELTNLKRHLYASETSVAFQHMAESTFNLDIALTVIPQPKGYMVLHLSVGKDYFVFEDTEVTDSKADGVMVHGTPFQVDGNGGAFWFSLAYIGVPRSSWIESYPTFPQGSGGVGQLGEMAFDGTSWAEDDIIATAVGQPDGSYVWRVEFACDPLAGKLPFLYRLYFTVPPQARLWQNEVTLLDSRLLPSLAWEYGTSRDPENRGRSATLTVFVSREHRGEAEWERLLNLGGKQVVISEGGVAVFTGRVGEKTEEDLVKGARRVSYRCYDRWAIIRADRCWYEVVGDGLTLGAHVTDILVGLGLTTAEVVITGSALTKRLPSSKPGEQPALRPEWGGSRGDYLQGLYDSHGQFMEMWFDGDGRFHLEPMPVQEPKPGAPVFARSHDVPGAVAVWDVEETVDDSNFANYLLVQGRAIRGKRLAAEYADYRSVQDPTYPDYVGRWIAAAPVQDDSLTTQEAVNFACVWKAWRECRMERTVKGRTWYTNAMSVGDVFWLDGRKVELLSSGMDDRTSGTMTLTARIIPAMGGYIRG